MSWLYWILAALCIVPTVLLPFWLSIASACLVVFWATCAVAAAEAV